MPTNMNVHQAVKDYFSTITLPELWEIGLEELEKKQRPRLYGKRAGLRVQQARHKQTKKLAKRPAGRKPYYPNGWIVA